MRHHPTQLTRRHRLVNLVLACLPACTLLLAGCGLFSDQALESTHLVTPTPTPPAIQVAVANGQVATRAILTPTPVQPTPPRTLDPPPTLTPTSSLSATPEPGAQEKSALQALEDGDYALAITLWEGVHEQAEPARAPAAAVSLARACVQEGLLHRSVELLIPVAEGETSSQQQAEALALLAGIYETSGEWRAAIQAFELYLNVDQAAEPYVRWRMARAYQALGEDDKALQQLVAVETADLPDAKAAEVLEELASVRRRNEDYTGALEVYDEILAFAQRADYRALILQKKGQTLREAGREDEAGELFRRVMRESPWRSAAYLALQALDAMDLTTVGALERGQILYHAGRYAECIDALVDYIGSGSAAETDQARYYLGLAYTRQGLFERAFEEFDRVIDGKPSTTLLADAWMAKARAEATYGGDPSGLYNEFWRRYPDHPRAPEALWRAAVALEEQGDWAEAAGFYRGLRTRYPQDSRASEALFREGLAAYVQRDLPAAHALWTEALSNTVASGEDSAEIGARLSTWLGLAAQNSGDASAAQAHWQEAVARSPWSYYGLRARDLSQGAAPVLAPDLSTTLPDDRFADAEWQTVSAWVRTWYSDTASSAGSLSEAPLTRRAVALWQLGWHPDALETYRLLRDAHARDPLALLALMRLADQVGANSITITCAERLLRSASAANADDPPTALLRLAYPMHFGHLVSAEAERYALDPLLFLALIRQESRFDPLAISYAGATGLTQVMPATGADIASRLTDGAYRLEHLTRPLVGVRYGTWYLNWLLDLNGRDWYAALIGYNAGPGNLNRWTGNQPIADYDLFYETVLAGQPKDYVTLIYENYRMYERIYRSENRTPDSVLSGPAVPTSP